MSFPIILIALMIISGIAGWVWGKRHPELQRRLRPALPYVWIFLVIDTGYIGYTAQHRKAWWFVPPALFLIMAFIEVVRQQRLKRAGH